MFGTHEKWLVDRLVIFFGSNTHLVSGHVFMASVAHMSSDGMKIGKASPLLSKFISQIYKQKSHRKLRSELLFCWTLKFCPVVPTFLENLERKGIAKASTKRVKLVTLTFAHLSLFVYVGSTRLCTFLPNLAQKELCF